MLLDLGRRRPAEVDWDCLVRLLQVKLLPEGRHALAQGKSRSLASGFLGKRSCHPTSLLPTPGWRRSRLWVPCALTAYCLHLRALPTDCYSAVMPSSSPCASPRWRAITATTRVDNYDTTPPQRGHFSVRPTRIFLSFSWPQTEQYPVFALMKQRLPSRCDEVVTVSCHPE